MHSELNGELLKWEKRFELGIHAIDEQHKYLVGLCSRLHGEIVSPKSSDEKEWRAAIFKALQETVNYTKTHFSLEERLMAASGYKSFAAHRKRHQELIEKISATLSSFDKINLQGALDFSKFIYEWILQHIAHEDKLYVKPVLEYLSLHK